MGDTISPLSRLDAILDILRRDCPWDRAQTIGSLRYLTIEEVYELSDAILDLQEEGGDSDAKSDNMKKELGDLLMHILFYSKIAHDEHRFSFDDVCTAVSDKLVSRHPHIALPLSDGTMRPALTDTHPGWEQVKMKEGRKSVLDGVPCSLPALVKAIRLQEKAAGAGYSEPHKSVDEWACAGYFSTDDMAAVGDQLFALVDALRKKGINADEALTLANERFADRVRHWEQKHSKAIDH